MSNTFLIKKIALYLLYPSGLIFLLLLGVSFYALWGKRRGRRRALLFTALLLYYLASTPFLPYYLLRPLEAGFKRPNPQELSQARAIVVLPAKIYGQKDLLLEERFSRETWARFIAALRLKKRLPEIPLIVAGGSLEGPGAKYLKEIGEELGFKVEALDAPLDTISTVAALKERLSDQPFVLLTSAHHLRRSMYLFKREGLSPIPYPAVYVSHTCRFTPFHILYLFPYPVYLELTNEAIHEYLGLSFYRLRDLVFGRDDGKN
ncbi:YdcF family protein [Thermosulfurimonas dismutans]|uniref:Putative membrane protein n=1 Tax=Thermosulfurimonas dismutans TaxID=999894 RepID=A0A179D5R2_9BACT|nr:ElyC/SanA/YdcF family protein [Thermosulfurimonas dismutans]OAQ20782.1 putative membrane protein [Thermosulfurimonas dismutans]